jgi:hypothetical protein
MNNNNNYNEKQREMIRFQLLFGGNIIYNLRISLIYNTSLCSNRVMSKVPQTIVGILSFLSVSHCNYYYCSFSLPPKVVYSLSHNP